MQVVTRDDAHLRGLKRYYTGKPCKRGHQCERFVSNGCCIDCIHKKTSGPNQRYDYAKNVGWPPRAIVFDHSLAPTQEQMHAAFLYAESVGWLNAALRKVQEEPDLMLQFVKAPTVQEIIAADQALQRLQRIQQVQAKARESDGQ